MKKNNYDPEKMRKIGYQMMTASGVASSVGKIVVDGLIHTSLRGVDSHGIRLLPHYINAVLKGRINPVPKFSFKNPMPSIGILDADDGFGIAAGLEAVKRVIHLSLKTGIAAISVKNSSHFGAAAIYTNKIAQNNMIGLACTHVESLVLPFNGVRPYLGTNALSIAVPCLGEEPVCLDMATSSISLNKLMLYKNANKKLPEDVAANQEGKITTDPRLATFLTHFGGYKGYGLALIVEILSSLLSGMQFGTHISPMYPLNKKRRKLGHFFIAINIAAFEKLSVFKKRMKQLADEIRETPSISSKKKVIIAGDPEKQEFALRQLHGIYIPPADFKEIIFLAKDLEIPLKDIYSEK